MAKTSLETRNRTFYYKCELEAYHIYMPLCEYITIVLART